MSDREDNYNPLNDTKLLDDINNAFIKKFKTDKFHYIYDVNTNEIVKVDKVIWNLFPDTEESYKSDISQLIEKHGKDELQRALNEISSSIEKEHLFSSNRPKICMTMTQEELEKHIRHKNEQTILNVTEDCNFRCKYCIYSGIYKNVRTHSKKYMKWETAKAAMDDFIVNSSEIENPAFSFYGGEPILAMELIEKCVAYLKKQKKKCRFNITTNGSLLDENNIQYFIKNNFGLSISLNGPREIHDTYRVYATGRESWETVINQTNLIRSIEENYFKNKVGFSCTFTPPFNISDCINFFLTSYPGNRVSFSTVDTKNTNFFTKKFGKKQLKKEYNLQISSLYNEYIRRFPDEMEFSDYTWILSSIFDSFPVSLHRRPFCTLNGEFESQGQCLIGTRRLFINTDGNYFPCERTNNQINIGNCYSGINFNDIYLFMSEYQNIHKAYCDSCFYIRLCIKCFKSIYRNGSLYKKDLIKFCESSKQFVLNSIISYLEIIEKNSKSLTKIEKLIIK